LHPDQITPSSQNQANSQPELQERLTCRRGLKKNTHIFRFPHPSTKP
jgi:hypothetical protein